MCTISPTSNASMSAPDVHSISSELLNACAQCAFHTSAYERAHNSAMRAASFSCDATMGAVTKASEHTCTRAYAVLHSTIIDAMHVPICSAMVGDSPAWATSRHIEQRNETAELARRFGEIALRAPQRGQDLQAHRCGDESRIILTHTSCCSGRVLARTSQMGGLEYCLRRLHNRVNLPVANTQISGAGLQRRASSAAARPSEAR